MIMGTTYWNDINETFSTLWKGLRLTLRHIFQARHTHNKSSISDNNYFDVKDGLMTVQYPHESIPVPDNGRYRLHNEIDDCIVCDKCAKICPVDCIEIESVRAVEEFGKTSDGTPKRIHAAKFDIDMGKCCFCGLCTTVCPTECLTMTKTYDFSEYDVDDHVYSFATMTPLEILEKKKELEEARKQKEEKDDNAIKDTGKAAKPDTKTGSKPKVGQPKIKPKTTPESARPKIRPKPLIPKKKRKNDD
jgi:NADH-quinone oxidoreductase subunit I